LGGEKLKSSRPFWGVFLTSLLLINGLFIAVPPLQAQNAASAVAQGQTNGQSPDQAVGGNVGAGGGAQLPDESTMVLGEAPQAPAANGGSSIFVVIRMVLVLALAALAVYGVVFFVKRMAKPRENRDPHLKVLARVSLTNETFAAVISVGAKAWLVGGSSGGVNLISEIDDPESLETMLLDDARKTAESGPRPIIDFQSLLARLKGPNRGGMNNTGNDAASPRAGNGSLPDALRKQRERLKGL